MARKRRPRLDEMGYIVDEHGEDFAKVHDEAVKYAARPEDGFKVELKSSGPPSVSGS